VDLNVHSFIKGSAMIAMITAACLISASPYLAAHSALTFCLFLYVHIIWSSYALVMKEYSLLVMNIGLMPFDFYAIGIRMFI